MRTVRNQARKDTINIFEERAKSSDVGKWTVELIPNVKVWLKRPHGEVNFYLAQFLTGRVHFNWYLHKTKRKNSPYCDYCLNKEDDVEHTFSECDRRSDTRRSLQIKIGKSISREHIVSTMLQNQQNWDAVATFVESVLHTENKEEQGRERV